MPSPLHSSCFDSLAISRTDFDANEAAFAAEVSRFAATLRTSLGPFKPGDAAEDLWEAALFEQAARLAATTLAYWYEQAHHHPHRGVNMRAKRAAALGQRSLGLKDPDLFGIATAWLCSLENTHR